jgi:hypothetical protein
MSEESFLEWAHSMPVPTTSALGDATEANARFFEAAPALIEQLAADVIALTGNGR